MHCTEASNIIENLIDFTFYLFALKKLFSGLGFLLICLVGHEFNNMYHHDLMPVFLVHSCHQTSTRTGSTGVTTPTTTSFNPLVHAKDPQEV